VKQGTHDKQTDKQTKIGHTINTVLRTTYKSAIFAYKLRILRMKKMVDPPLLINSKAVENTGTGM
jgi:hypothetical protein